MGDKMLKAIFMTGAVVMWVGLVGEVIWYGETYEMLMFLGCGVMAVAGGAKLWEK